MADSKDTLGDLPSLGELPQTATPAKAGRHRSNSSDLSELSLISINIDLSQQHHDDGGPPVEIKVTENLEETSKLPKGSLLVITDKENLETNDDGGETKNDHEDAPVLAELPEILDFEAVAADTFRCVDWDGTKYYSDFIKDGLQYLKKEDLNVVMLFESPSTSSTESSFHNKTKFKFHDWPPPKSVASKQILGPCRYASMNGSSFPLFLRDGKPPQGLVEHWQDVIPNHQPTSYVSQVRDGEDTAYAYLPVEQIRNHLNDPDTHYHLAGKDAIHMMTQKTTKLLPDTSTVRPCVVKTTHSMGSKGIFIIQNDEDEKEFLHFLEISGNPTFVVTDFVDIDRNVACHFFMHPDGSITWFGSNENHREIDGSFSSDSYLLMEHQEKLKAMQLPFVEEVTRYCHGLGFWGFCGIDVLFDPKGRGHLVDINPRVTGSCPALMTLKLLSDKYNYQVGLFRRSGKTFYHGNAEQLMSEVGTYNKEHEGNSIVIIHSYFMPSGQTAHCKLNIGVYGNSLIECKKVLNHFARDKDGSLIED